MKWRASPAVLVVVGALRRQREPRAPVDADGEVVFSTNSACGDPPSPFPGMPQIGTLEPQVPGLDWSIRQIIADDVKEINNSIQ
ncbi:hypothetical protein ACP70R_030372 [Stipagrostis hirtigluma subsp. patula]